MTRRRLVTERDVQRAARAGEKTLDVAGAVITPSAREAATHARVELTGGAAPPVRPSRMPVQRPARADKGSRAAGAERSSRAGGTGRATRPAEADAAPAQPPPRSGKAANEKGAASSPEKPLAVAHGADHGGVSLKSAIADRLRELGLKVLDFGTVTRDPVDYPDFAVAVAQAVASGRATVGVMIDGAGIGSCMAANKVRGVRAAMCYDVTTATNAREHNNANVLTLGAGLIGTRLALNILETFLSTPFAGGRHATRVSKIDALDRPG